MKALLLAGLAIAGGGMILCDSANAQRVLPKLYEKFKPAGQTDAYVPVFSSKALGKPLDRIEHLLVLVHGASYKGDAIYQTVAKAFHDRVRADDVLMGAVPGAEEQGTGMKGDHEG